MAEPAAGLRFVFAPDFAAVAALMRRTWDQPTLVYDEDLLRLHIDRPTGDSSLALAQVDAAGRPMTFHAFMPFCVEWKGRPFRAVFASFLTVARELQCKGIVAPMQEALIERAIERGHELYLVMCEEGAPSNEAIGRVFARRGTDFRLINVFGYLMTLRSLLAPTLPETPRGRTRSLAPGDALPPFDLVARLGEGAALRKIVDERDVAFVLRDRPCATTFVFEESGRIVAFANLLVLKASEGDVVRKNAYFENVVFGDLSVEQRREFLGDVLNALHASDVHAIFAPATGAWPVEDLRPFRFRRAPRRINLYAAPLTAIAQDAIAPVDAFALDVF